MAAGESPLPYLERSRPNPAWLAAGAFVIACIAIAYGSMLGRTAGALVVIAGIAILAVVQMLASWQIRLDDTLLKVGSASVDATRIVGAEALDAQAARYLAGPGADARAVFKLRGGKPAVRIDLDDPRCPYWLVTSRTPDALAAAVAALPQQSAP